MYFPVGCPTFYNARKQTGCDDALISVCFNRSRSLFVTLSHTTVYIWKSEPHLLLATWKREEKSIHDQGDNKSIYWNPDSSTLAVVTSNGFVILVDILENSKEYNYYLEQSSADQPIRQLQKNGILKFELVHKITVTLKGFVASISTRHNELFIATTEGWVHRLKWEGEFNTALAMHISDLLFCVDLETPTIGSPLTKNRDLFISTVECSPVLGGFAIVLSDGRGGFLSSSTPEAKTEDIVGIFAKDLTNAVTLAVNIKYQIIVFGQTTGQGVAYCFDDFNGGLVVSHRYVLPKKDYPDEGASAGSLYKLCWSPDGSVLATAWSIHGVAIWSVFGALLMCLQNMGSGTFHRNLQVSSLDWGSEGYELLVLASSESAPINIGDIVQLKFVKSAISVNPCVSNHQHLFLQGKSCLHVNMGDILLQNNHSPSSIDTANNSSSMHFSNKHWQTFQLPQSYVIANTPIRYAVIDDSSKYLAAAGLHGYLHFSLARRKWKMFGNETQERNVTCRGGMVWWQNFLVVGCYNFHDEVDEVCIHKHSLNLDVTQCFRFTANAPIFLMNLYNNVLLVYCADCSISFYELQTVGNEAHCPGVSALKISESSLIEYLIHPITVTSLRLTALKSQQQSDCFLGDNEEIQSLIANVAGKLLMLQKEKSSEQNPKELIYLTPLCLASCVENVWYSVNPTTSKKQLAESLWLACGAHGMQAWLPLFPTRRPIGFLSKRIMLHFQLHLYPLAVLFEDAVILGIGNEDLEDCLSPMHAATIPYFTLERTAQVYLPQILKQLLRRNLGVHALDIARSCTNLPYFSHVLELMLHEVLEREATASNPIPDPLLPRVVAFIQEFPQFLETVCHCARKTEVALWPHLFSVVGPPIELFKSCYTTGKLETAASYLLILQSLESPSVSRQHATILLDTALEERKLDLARDLVRFLRAIGRGDTGSPPRTPHALQHKTSFHHNLSGVNLDDSLPSPVVSPVQRQSRTTIAAPLTRTTSAGKERPIILKLVKKDSDTNCAKNSSPMDSCEHFYTEMILSRFARRLLSSYALNDLGLFSSKLDFDLHTWLVKERYRAACVENFMEAMASLHEQFDWIYPDVSTINTYTLLLRNAEKECSTAEPSTPSVESERSYNDDSSVKEVTLNATLADDDVQSDTVSLFTVANSNNDDSEMVDIQSVISLQGMVSTSSQAKLRYMLAVFAATRCVDWVLLLSIMLLDLTMFNQVLEKSFALHDFTMARLKNLIEQLQQLYKWLDTKCPAYQPLLSTILANCQTLLAESAETAFTSAEQTPDDSATPDAATPRDAGEGGVSPEDSQGHEDEYYQCVIS